MDIKTNGDFIRYMDDVQLADFLYTLLKEIEKPRDETEVKRYLLEWLQEEIN